MLLKLIAYCNFQRMCYLYLLVCTILNMTLTHMLQNFTSEALSGVILCYSLSD